MRELLTFKPLQQLYDEVLISWDAGHPVEIIAGQRSGKSTLCLALAQSVPQTTVIVHSQDEADRNQRRLPQVQFSIAADYIARVKNSDGSRDTLIVDEFHYLKPEQLRFLQTVRLRNKLLIGSSPEYWVRRNYSTWDLNPSLGPERISQLYERHENFNHGGAAVFNGVWPAPNASFDTLEHVQV